MTTPIQNWLDLLLPMVPGLTDDVARQHLLKTFQDFLAYSYMWQETLPPIALVSNQAEYPLVGQDDADIATVLHVWTEDYDIPPIDLFASLRDCYGWRWDKSTSSLILSPAPGDGATGTLNVRVALIPTDLSFPVQVVDGWQDAIISGVLGSIHTTMLHLPSVAPTLGQWHMQRYMAARARARVQALSLAGPIGYSVGRNALGGLA